MDTGIPAPLEVRRQEESPTAPAHLYRRHNPRVKNLCYEVKECTRKHSESVLVGWKLAELLDVLHVRLLDQANPTPASAKHFKVSGKRVEQRR